MNDQNQLIPNEKGDLPQINEMLKPIFFAIFSTALSVGVSRISDIVSQFYLGNKEKLGTAVEEKDSEALVGAKSADSLSKTDQIINITPKNEIEIKELNPEKLFDIQLQNLLSKLDSSENNQEIIDKFINDNFKEIKSHPLKHDLVSNIQEFLSSTDDEFITNRQKKIKLHNFFAELKNSNMPETFNKVVKIVVAKKMSDLILNYPKYGGYMNHLCFHQEFELLESLLEGSSKDIIGEERLKSLAESSDTGHLTANLLQCSAIMGTVANDGYLKKITDIYSKYPPKKIVNEYLMLNPENFKKIFQPEYFKERKINKNQKLLKSIQDFDTDFVRETMGEVDLHPLTLDKEGGFQKTTIEKRTNDIKELYNALKEGRGIMVKKNTLDSLRLLFSEKGEEIDDKIEEQILVVRGNAVGIIKSAIGDQKSIEDVARDNVEENLKYLKETLTAILKPSETLSKPAIEKNQKSPEL